MWPFNSLDNIRRHGYFLVDDDLSMQAESNVLDDNPEFKYLTTGLLEHFQNVRFF